MGLENAAPELNPGLASAANLVPGTQDYTIAPKAVENMRAALKDGFITAADIGERFSHREGIKKQLQTQMLQNELKKQQADAPLIQPRADLQSGQLQGALNIQPVQQQADQVKAGMDLSNAQFTERLQPMAQKMAEYQSAQALQNAATGGDAQALAETGRAYGILAQRDDKGVITNMDELRQKVGQLGQYKMFQAYQKAYREGTTSAETKRTNPDGSEVTTRKVFWTGTNLEVPPHTQEMFGGLVPGGAGNFSAPLVAPKAQTPPSDIPINPKEQTPPTDGLTPSGALETTTKTGMTDAEKVKQGMEVTGETRKLDSYKDWEKSRGFYGNAEAQISAINKVPVQDQRSGKVNLNTRDIALAEAVVKMLDPQGAVREFKWNKMEESQPWPEILRDLGEKVKREGKFTPESRQELMKVANESLRAHENVVADYLKQTKAKQGPLTDQEEALASGQRTPVYTPPSWYQGAGQAPAAGAAPQAASKTYGGKQWALGQTYSDPKTGARWTVTDFDSSGKPILGPAK